MLCEACAALGWKTPTKIQQEALPLALEGRERGGQGRERGGAGEGTWRAGEGTWRGREGKVEGRGAAGERRRRHVCCTVAVAQLKQGSATHGVV